MKNYIILENDLLDKIGTITIYKETLRQQIYNNMRDLRPEYTCMNKVYKSMGEGNVSEMVRKIMEDNNYIVRSKLCKLAMVFSIKVSSDFFTTNGYVQGKEPPKIVTQLFDDLYQFILDEYGYNGGENILCCSVHYDETTPHLQGVLIPVCKHMVIESNKPLDLPLVRTKGKGYLYYKESEYPVVGLHNFYLAKYKMPYKYAFGVQVDHLCEVVKKYNLTRGEKGKGSKHLNHTEWGYVTNLGRIEQVQQETSRLAAKTVLLKDEYSHLTKKLELLQKDLQERQNTNRMIITKM